MKVYVRGYRQRDEDKVLQPQFPFDPIDNIDVQFSEESDWKIECRELAEVELRNLCSMRVHVGAHYCELSIKEIPESKFAIVCLSHPELHLNR